MTLTTLNMTLTDRNNAYENFFCGGLDWNLENFNDSQHANYLRN